MSGTPSAKKPSGTLNFVLDFGPLFLFFVASKFGSSDTDPKQGAIVGTAAFMAAILVAVSAALTAFTDGDPATTIDFASLLAACIAGVGLICARDGDKTSEAIGAK